RRERMAAANAQLDSKIAQLEKFVERFGAKNTKAAQAQSKRKQIARLKTERVVIPRKGRRLRFEFPPPPHAGRSLVRLKDMSFGYGERDVLSPLLMAPANLLLLDEPTHHLDLAGKEVLEDALSQYPGAVVVVTHDRSLMARLATRILEVDGGKVRLYPGGYDDYESTRLA